MNEAKQIISVKEARKLLGKDGQKLTDQEVVKLIDDLHFIAKHSLKMARDKREQNSTDK